MSKDTNKMLTTNRIDRLHIDSLLTKYKEGIGYEKYKGDRNIVYDKIGDILNLETADIVTAMQAIKRYQPLRITTHNKELFKALKASGLYIISYTCYQCGVTKNMLGKGGEREEEEEELKFNSLAPFEIQGVKKIYPHLTESDIKVLVKNNWLFSIVNNEKPIGYIGKRIDGSIGMLYIFKYVRGSGYGKAVFSKFSEMLLENNDSVYTRIPCDDIAMMSILSDIGYTISDNCLYLLMNKEY